MLVPLLQYLESRMQRCVVLRRLACFNVTMPALQTVATVCFEQRHPQHMPDLDGLPQRIAWPFLHTQELHSCAKEPAGA